MYYIPCLLLTRYLHAGGVLIGILPLCIYIVVLNDS